PGKDRHTGDGRPNGDQRTRKWHPPPPAPPPPEAATPPAATSLLPVPCVPACKSYVPGVTFPWELVAHRGARAVADRSDPGGQKSRTSSCDSSSVDRIRVIGAPSTLPDATPAKGAWRARYQLECWCAALGAASRAPITWHSPV